MKTYLHLAACGLAAVAAIAQGTLHLCNRGPEAGVDAPFYDWDGTRLGPAFVAQMFAGLEPEGLNPVGAPTALGDGADRGYFDGGTVAIPWAPEGSGVFLKVWAWEAAKGQTANEAGLAGSRFSFSNVIYVYTGGEDLIPPRPPGELVGLRFAGTSPETLIITQITATGGQVILAWNGYSSRYQVQHKAALDQPWESVSGPLAQISWTNALTGPVGFSRVVGLPE